MKLLLLAPLLLGACVPFGTGVFGDNSCCGGWGNTDPYAAALVLQTINRPFPTTTYQVQPVPQTYHPVTVVPYFQ